MNGEYPVEQTTRRFFFFQNAGQFERMPAPRAPSYFVSLDRTGEERMIRPAPLLRFQIQLTVRHSFQRTIAGRCYLIEVAQVDDQRWRAHILKLPGVPAAMMPFYGSTPDEAATNLS